MLRRIFEGHVIILNLFIAWTQFSLSHVYWFDKKWQTFAALNFYLSHLTVGTVSRIFTINFNQILGTRFGQMNVKALKTHPVTELNKVAPTWMLGNRAARTWFLEGIDSADMNSIQYWYNRGKRLRHKKAIRRQIFHLSLSVCQVSIVFTSIGRFE